MVPTVLEAQIDPPEAIRGVTQSPIQGVSFAHTFNDKKAPSKHVTQ
jgi:arylsulfatase